MKHGEGFSGQYEDLSNEEQYKKTGNTARNSYEAAETAEKARSSQECRRIVTTAAIAALVGMLAGGGGGFLGAKMAAKNVADEPQIESENTLDAVDPLAGIGTTNIEEVVDEGITTSGEWAGESSNGVKYDYELAGFINSDRSIIAYHWEDEDGNGVYDYGRPIELDWTQEDWKESFDAQIDGNPSILGRVAANVLTEDQISSLVNEYNGKDENSDNDISINFSKDVGDQLDTALRGAAEGDAIVLQEALKDAIKDEAIDNFEHVYSEDFEAETSVLKAIGKDPTFADIVEGMVEHKYDVFDGAQVTFANGNVVIFGQCGAPQVVIPSPEEEVTPVPTVTQTPTKTGSEKTGGEATVDEKTGSEKTGSEATVDEKTGSEKTGGEKTGGEKTSDENITPKGPDTYASDDVDQQPTTPVDNTNYDYVEPTPEDYVTPEPGSSSEANPDSGNPNNTNYSNDDLANIYNDF